MTRVGRMTMVNRVTMVTRITKVDTMTRDKSNKTINYINSKYFHFSNLSLQIWSLAQKIQ